MIRFLASGDIHLGRTSSATPEAAGIFPANITWQLMVQKAIDLKVNAVLLSGDIIDRENRFFEAVGQLQHGFNRLRQENIAVFIVAGNHDFDSLPDAIPQEDYSGIRLLGAKGQWEVVPFSVGDVTVQLAGWSFPSQYIKTNPALSFPTDQLNPAFPVIGLLHGEVGKSDSPYAPIDRQSLLTKNVNLWVLGHIHKPQSIGIGQREIWYPGSPQALSPKEQGKHGVLLIEVDNQHKVTTEFLSLSPVQYEELSVDLSAAVSTRSEILDRIKELVASDRVAASTEQLILDLILTGEHQNPDLVTQTIPDLISGHYHQMGDVYVSVRKYVDQLTISIDLASMAEQSSPPGLVAQTILAIENNLTTPLLEELEQQWEEAYETVKNGTAYYSLHQRGRDILYLDEVASKKREYLLMVCNRLLRELIQQTA